MNRRRTTLASTAVALILGAALGGCTSEGRLAVFEKDRTAADAFPETAPNVMEGIDAGSTRFLWENDESSFYAAEGEGANEGRTCLVIVDRNAGASAACGGLPVTIGIEGRPSYRLDDAGGGSDRWTEVADYLYVEETD